MIKFTKIGPKSEQTIFPLTIENDTLPDRGRHNQFKTKSRAINDATRELISPDSQSPHDGSRVTQKKRHRTQKPAYWEQKLRRRLSDDTCRDRAAGYRKGPTGFRGTFQ